MSRSVRAYALFAAILASYGLFVADAPASIIIEPGDQVSFETSANDNLSLSDIESLVGLAAGTLWCEAFKSDYNEGEPVESGPYATYYNVTHDPDGYAVDSALIEWVGTQNNNTQVIYAEYMYLIVKDGKNNDANVGNYVFDLTDINGVAWNGKDDIVVEGFWPDKGIDAISHVAIVYGGRELPPPPQSNEIPEPLSLVVWSLLGAGSLGGVFLRYASRR